MLWHRQAIFESKGDKLSPSAECRIRAQRVSETQSPADWMPADKLTELSRIKQKVELEYTKIGKVWLHLKCLICQIWSIRAMICYAFTCLVLVGAEGILMHYSLVKAYGDTDLGAFALVHQLMAASHYLNQYWLLISEVMWHPPLSNSTESTQPTVLHNVFENCKITATSLRVKDQWVDQLPSLKKQLPRSLCLY